MKLENYVLGSWKQGNEQGTELFDASFGKSLGFASTAGINFGEILNYARTVGGPNLRKQTFHDRARALKQLALYLLERKEKYYQISYQTGATKIDSWIDIEGGIGNLFTYSSKGRREMPDSNVYSDGAPEMLSKGGTFTGQHIFVPKRGVAVHINAFNFPVWGMLEKIAVNLVAGMPCVVKPATVTSYLTEAVVKDIIESKLLPEGALQLLCGSASGILDHVTSQDVVTFTGSAWTGQKLKSHPRITEQSVPFNMEADSLNCCILGEDVKPDSDDFNVFIKEVAKEMTIKAGQKCTAIRRTIVPENMIEPVQKALIARLQKVAIGSPTAEGVRMGPLAGMSQKKEVLEKIEELKQSCELLYHNEDFQLLDGDREKGAFISPTLLLAKDPMNNSAAHSVEAFGPVSTLIPYKGADQAIELSHMGEGSLVGSIVSSDKKWASEVAVGMASHHGRIVILNESCAKESTGHGSPLPNLVHGGPGRAGGGEEMGGMRGIKHYMQRTAIQGHPTFITDLTQVYQPGGERPEADKHPFRHYFEELEVGMTLTTHKRTVTEADVVNFANLSWDHFYAHTDTTSLEGTIFDERVAHGYFVISAAAGLFVDPGKGPVLANYGLDELRFIKPVYVGATLGVKLTCKEKIPQDPREGEVPRGVVRWQVDVSDETGETVALATILTLVAKKTT
ncbi:MAG: phenylacetic acid degradation bifunctional protein PaaZ [Oligoflexia bacterium]|nr:phenylacetic acid degradation bifunctional protein PaaZ [Oligoflexia bacterium]